MLFRRRKRKVKRIMIVEDEPLIAFDNEVMLGDAGYEVVATLDNYADAVALLDREPIDLILCDISLAGAESGLDLARDARLRDIPVLLVTASVPEEAAALAVGVLRKPYGARTLPAVLDRVDRHLSGELAEEIKGLELFAAASR